MPHGSVKQPSRMISGPGDWERNTQTATGSAAKIKKRQTERNSMVD
jgi:hypothetical protein